LFNNIHALRYNFRLQSMGLNAISDSIHLKASNIRNVTHVAKQVSLFQSVGVK